jgi:serine/threonine-protein kinase
MLTKAPLKKLAFRVGKLISLLVALGATYGLFVMVSFQLALKSREVPVPSLTGMTPQEAETVLADAGLNLRIDPVRRVHDTIILGRVAEQDPSPGLTTRSQRSVKTWLSSGPTPDSIPGLIGASESAARRNLAENAFSLYELAEIRSDRYPIDVVVAQQQPPDSNGQLISLLVNRGERGRTFVMPDLIGVDSAAAADVLRTRGFRITVVGDHPYPGVPSGVVLRQSPEAGFQIAPGESISLEVSQ